MGFLSNLFGGKRKQAIIDALLKGAKIIDVRTVSEFKVDHIEGAINIPIDRLNNEIKRIKKMRTPIVVCCESGSRSGAAKRMLQNAGIETINGGSWYKVYRLVMET